MVALKLEPESLIIYACIILPQRNKQSFFKLNTPQAGQHMAALKSSLVVVFLLYSLACSGKNENATIKSYVEGCFTLTELKLDTTQEPIILRATVGPEDKKQDCPCKSALFEYSAYQERENETHNLMTGNFTTMGKEFVLLPVSVQKQLIFSDKPILVKLSCSGP